MDSMKGTMNQSQNSLNVNPGSLKSKLMSLEVRFSDANLFDPFRK